MGISVTGVQRTIQAQRIMGKKDAMNIAAGLKKCGEVLLRKSQTLVPVDTGALKASGKVEVTGVGFSAKVFVSYDGPYAIYVHENLSAYHAPPTRARYLAAAYPMVVGTMTSILKRQIKIGLT